MSEDRTGDGEALDAIAGLLQESVWQLGHLTRIAAIVRSTGRQALDHPQMFLSSTEAASGHQMGAPDAEPEDLPSPAQGRDPRDL
jgi:hypothetical protein